METPHLELITKKPQIRMPLIFHEQPRYYVYKFSKWLQLKDYIQINRFVLDKRHMTVFTCILNARKTIQMMLFRGNFIYVSGYGKVSYKTLIRTEPGEISMAIPEIGFGIKFKLTEQIIFVLDGQKYTNCVCVCRKYM